MTSANTHTALVTGASGGLGSEIALELSRQGYDLVLHCHRNREKVTCLQEEITAQGNSSRILQFDISDRDASRTALEEDIAEHGAYYGVVCNAGLHMDSPFPGMVDEQWDRVMDVNLHGFYNILRPVILPMIQLRQGGRIVTISSVSGQVGNRGQTNYSAAKAGIIGATKSLAIELAKRNICVNCVAPGVIETEMISDIHREQVLKAIPMQRYGKATDVAAAVGFLMSDSASYITRQVIAVNGGMI